MKAKSTEAELAPTMIVTLFEGNKVIKRVSVVVFVACAV